MNHFTLFAHGTDFQVDNFLAATSLRIDRTWRRGDLRGHPLVIQDRHPTSGVEICLGSGRTLDIDEQDRIAADFLEANEPALRAMGEFPGVDTFILGLHFRIELDISWCCFCMSLSARLLYFALRIGVRPTFYVEVDQAQPEDDE